MNVLQMFHGLVARGGLENGVARIDCGLRGGRGPSRRRPGANRGGDGGLHHRRAGRQGGRRIARTGPFGPHRFRPRASSQAHHRQSRAGRHAQGGQPLRSSDHARRHGGDRGHSARRPRRFRGHRRTGARRFDQRGRRRPAGCDRRQRRRQGPHLPRALRSRGGMGLGRPRYSRSPLADPARQSFPRLASADAPRAGFARRPRASGRPARHQGSGKRQAGARDRSRRRPQPADEWRSRSRQVDARPASAVDSPAADPARIARSVDGSFGGRHSRRRRADRPAAVPGATSFRFDAGAGRRRRARQARRDFARSQRRAVPRRIAGIPRPGARQPQTANRNGRGRHRPRQSPGRLSGADFSWWRR